MKNQCNTPRAVAIHRHLISMNHNFKAFPRVENWGKQHFQQPPFLDITSLVSLHDVKDWPDVAELSKLLNTQGQGIDFIEQVDDSRYYEQIIFEDLTVPTRSCNWHDFYNACIWRLFPQAKKALNRIHIQEMSQFGLTPRTPRRDRVTHFDECGIVLAYSDKEVKDALSEHEWEQAFVTYRQSWGKSIKAFVFGHANYEMLMSAHIGLTGKWFGVEVDNGFWQLPLAEQYQHLDTQVLKYAESENSFTRKQELKPLPLLGIPGWWDANQQPEFYANTQYFRPKRRT